MVLVLVYRSEMVFLSVQKNYPCLVVSWYVVVHGNVCPQWYQLPLVDLRDSKSRYIGAYGNGHMFVSGASRDARRLMCGCVHHTVWICFLAQVTLPCKFKMAGGSLYPRLSDS